MTDVAEWMPMESGRAVELDCAAAEALGGRICTAAGLVAEADCQLLELIAAFDAGNAVRWFAGVTSLAHWLAWSCSMSPGTAREHVRVARALPKMPTVTAAFRQGRLSYSKVREISRVVDTVDEAQLCTLAMQATAAQLAKTVSGYRTASGTRVRQERERRLTWTERESGAVDLRLRLPKEEAATVIAALQAAKDQFGTPAPPLTEPPTERTDGRMDASSEGPSNGSPSETAQLVSESMTGPSSAESRGSSGRQRQSQSSAVKDSSPAYTLADAALDMARVFLATAPEDRSGEDRSLVVVHVNADSLTGRAGDVPAGTSAANSPVTPTEPAESKTDPAESLPDPAEPATDPAATLPEPAAPEVGPALYDDVGVADLAAGTLSAGSSTCHVQGLGGIERETARKLACDADLLGAIIDAHGDVLALGRTRRLVSRAQRRALMIRDQGSCQFTGCHHSRHLKAHHLIHWIDGGPTDLDNLLLLCQFHHTAVHEGRMIIRRAAPRRWEFLMPDGSPHRDWWSAEGLLTFLQHHGDLAAGGGTDWDRAEQRRRARTTKINTVTSFSHPDARRIQPGWSGERYDRHEAVQALFRMPVPTTTEPADQSADQSTDQAA